AFVNWTSPNGGDGTLGFVDFSIFPHLGHALMSDNTLAEAEKWAAGIAGPAYAIDDQTAIKVTDGTVEVVSEGHWKLLPLGSCGAAQSSARVVVCPSWQVRLAHSWTWCPTPRRGPRCSSKSGSRCRPRRERRRHRSSTSAAPPCLAFRRS